MARSRLGGDVAPTARLPASRLPGLALGDPLSSAAPSPTAISPFGELVYRIAYGAVWVMTWLFFRVYFRLRIENPPRLQGPFLVVANHASYLDPLLLGAAIPRRCVFMMTEVIYRSPRSRFLYRLFRAIPIAVGGGNRDAIRAARHALGRGEVVAVFPEGGLSRDGGLYLGNPGAVSLVLSEGVPVVPVAIVGAARAFGVQHAVPRPSKIVVRCGAPIEPDELAGDDSGRKQRLANATERIMGAIAELGDQTAREDQLRGHRPQKTAKA